MLAAIKLPSAALLSLFQNSFFLMADSLVPAFSSQETSTSPTVFEILVRLNFFAIVQGLGALSQN